MNSAIAPQNRVTVLMYHSISHHTGPTCIAPKLFAAQIEALGEVGYSVVRLADYIHWRSGKLELPKKTAVLTFDDAFADFATNAAPVMQAHGWTATVFAPTACIGGRADWSGGQAKPQQLLHWSDIRALSQAGFEFGSHSATHPDLTRLGRDAVRAELVHSKAALEEKLGLPVRLFAAPYGAANESVRTEIARHYELAVGVRLARADSQCDIFDVPRIEMHYFRDLRIWRRFLEGKAEGYLAIRGITRSIRASFAGRVNLGLYG